MEVDVIGGAEAQRYWYIVPGLHQLFQLIQQQDGARIVTVHNINERFTIVQQGGAFISVNKYSRGDDFKWV